jgi:hypothetical protein
VRAAIHDLSRLETRLLQECELPIERAVSNVEADMVEETAVLI